MIHRRAFLHSAATIGGILACPPAFAVETDEDERLDGFFERVFQQTLDRSPIRQSALGIRRDQDKWDDLSTEARDKAYRALLDNIETANRFDAAKLSPASILSLRMFVAMAEQDAKNQAWNDHAYLMSNMAGVHTRVPSTLINSHPISNRIDAEAYIARLEAVKPLFAQAIDVMERQEAKGIRPPRFVYDLVIQPCENVLKGSPFERSAQDSPLMADFRAKVERAGFRRDEHEALITRATAALSGNFSAGYMSLIAYLKEARKRADTRDGIWKLPDGDAYYASQLAYFTTLPLEPAEVHRLGLAEVARIHDEIRVIMNEVGFKGDLKAFFRMTREDERFYYADTNEGRAAYLADAEALLGRIRSRQGELFGVLPIADVEIRRIETWREGTAPKAHYRNPAGDGSAPGIYYVNLIDMKAQPRFQLPALLFHEAIPGHHVETCIAHEGRSLPKFRRFASIAAFSEGWGLYSEQLAKEIGFYEDPYEDFGRLTMSLMRACRLVVDTGLHHLKWTREVAVAYLDENLPLSPYDNRREVDRYIVLPGQACAYYIGKWKILELRERARAALGSAFDLRRFHDVTLGAGPLPLSLLEQRIDAWVEAGGGDVL